MKRSTYLRPLIASLALAVASGTAFSQGNQGQGQGEGQRQGYSECDHSGKGHGGKGQHGSAKGSKHGQQGQHGHQGMLMQLPEQVLAQLNLTPDQQAKYAKAQEATQSMRSSMREGKRQGMGKGQMQGDGQGMGMGKGQMQGAGQGQGMGMGKGQGSANGMSAENFDPRAMFERQNQRFEQRQAARKSIQQEWLGFWDSLNQQQQTVLKDFVQANGKNGAMSGHGRG